MTKEWNLSSTEQVDDAMLDEVLMVAVDSSGTPVLAPAAPIITRAVANAIAALPQVATIDQLIDSKIAAALANVPKTAGLSDGDYLLRMTGGESSFVPYTAAAGTPPAAPVISTVATNDSVSVSEAAAGVTISGTAESGSTVTVTWSAINKTTTATGGNWSVSFASGQIPAAGTTTVYATASNSDGPGPTATKTVTVEAEAVTSANFTAASTGTNFPHPERGVLGWFNQQSSAIQAEVAAGYKLARMHINLGAYQNTDTLPGSIATNLTTLFGAMRTYGGKCILRFQYHDTGGQPVLDPSVTRILGHISQLGTAVSAGADVIQRMELGFFGAYGENHSSPVVTTSSQKLQIYNACFTAFTGITLAFRTPALAKLKFPTAPTVADIGTDLGRAAFYNDAYLAINNDAGTYTGSSDRNYAAAMGDVNPMNVEFAPDINLQDGSYSNMVAESALMNLGGMNRYGAYATAKAAWTAGQIATIEAKMGDRLQLVSITHDAEVIGNEMDMSVVIKNDGWARLASNRYMVVKLSKSGNTYTYKVSTHNLRALLGSGETATLAFTATFSGIVAGTYSVALAFPDGAASLASNVLFNIRPANADSGSQVYSNGYMATGTTVTVS